jgi:hypothetical protein
MPLGNAGPLAQVAVFPGMKDAPGGKDIAVLVQRAAFPRARASFPTGNHKTFPLNKALAYRQGAFPVRRKPFAPGNGVIGEVNEMAG